MAQLLPQRYKIDFQQKLPELNTVAGDAYAVRGDSPTGAKVYAVVHSKAFPGRPEIIAHQRKNPMPNLANVIDRGVIDFSTGHDETVERMVSIIEKPAGKPLASGTTCVRMSEKELKENFLKPALVLLANMHGRDLIHRAISPYWIFTADKDNESITFGECATASPGADQPDLFEPIERLLIPFFARGRASAAADIYALGMTAFCLYIGEVPDLGEDPDKSFHERISRGTYWLISSGRNTPTSMETFFKGVLTDDAEERWTLNDIAQWLDGSSNIKRARKLNVLFARPVKYQGSNYTDRRLLVKKFAENPEKAAAYLRSSEFSLWVAQFLSNEAFSDRMESLLNVQMSDGFDGDPIVDQAMVTRVSAFLDPYGPLHYRGLTLSYDAIPEFLAVCYQENDLEGISKVEDLLGSGLYDVLIEIVGTSNYTAHKSAGMISRKIGAVKNNKVGQGLERFLYEIRPDLPCLSGHFKGVWVSDLTSIILAMENILQDKKRARTILDPHVAAYLAVKMDMFNRLFLTHSGMGFPDGQKAANFVEIFGALQLELNLGPLPNLAKAFAESLKTMVRSLKLEERRDKVAKQLMEIADSGEIGRLLTELQIGQLKKLDDREFAAAKMRYTALEAEKKRLSLGVKASDPRALLEGYRWISYVAFIILGLAGFAVFS